MSVWMIGLITYLAFSAIIFLLLMSMLILGKRSDQRSSTFPTKRTLQRRKKTSSINCDGSLDHHSIGPAAREAHGSALQTRSFVQPPNDLAATKRGRRKAGR